MQDDPWAWTATFSRTDQPRKLHRIDQAAAANEAACGWCRECGSCDAGLPMNCTCGDCTCAKRCGHPRCLLGLPRQWAHGPDQDRPDSWYEHDPDEGYEFDRDGNPR